MIDDTQVTEDQIDDLIDEPIPATFLVTLAERCEDGARALLHTAENAADILPGRANGHLADVTEWAAQKRSAAAAATDYAAALRAEAEQLIPTGSYPTERRIAQADLVATAAGCDGILIDIRRGEEHKLFGGTNTHWYEHERELWAVGEHPAQVKAREIVATGLFEYIAETINGVPQVAFWRMRQVAGYQLNDSLV